MSESRRPQMTHSDFIKQQKSMLRGSEINVSMSNKHVEEIRMKSNFLGRNGWAISPFWRPFADETWYDTWFWIAYNGSADNISKYFIDNDYSLLKNINAFSRFSVDRIDWFMESEKLFEEHYYTSCAMLLTAILEESVRRCPIEGWRKQVTVFFDNLVCAKIEDYYHKRLEPLNRYIETILLLPSIDGFLNHYFKSNYPFGKNNDNTEKTEAPFLERNWLMHGLTQRQVTELDCIRLFNVIASLHYTIRALFQKS